MATFDQRGQKLMGNQYNAGRDITINQDRYQPLGDEKREMQLDAKRRQKQLSNDKDRQQKMYSLLFCYAHEDEEILNRLKNHLLPLQHQGILTTWYDRNISPGAEWEQEITLHLNTADIILVLISSDFMASDYCYGIEMRKALMRHEQKQAIVIPIILRPVYWKNTPLGKLQVLPTDAEPVISSGSRTIDEALFNVTEGIHRLIEKLTDLQVP